MSTQSADKKKHNAWCPPNGIGVWCQETNTVVDFKRSKAETLARLDRRCKTGKHVWWPASNDEMCSCGTANCPYGCLPGEAT